MSGRTPSVHRPPRRRDVHLVPPGGDPRRGAVQLARERRDRLVLRRERLPGLRARGRRGRPCRRRSRSARSCRPRRAPRGSAVSTCTPAGSACVMCSSIPDGAIAVTASSTGLPTVRGDLRRQRQLEARAAPSAFSHGTQLLQRERVAEARHGRLGGDAPRVRARAARGRRRLEHEHVAQLLAIERAGRDRLAVQRQRDLDVRGERRLEQREHRLHAGQVRAAVAPAGRRAVRAEQRGAEVRERRAFGSPSSASTASAVASLRRRHACRRRAPRPRRRRGTSRRPASSAIASRTRSRSLSASAPVARAAREDRRGGVAVGDRVEVALERAGRARGHGLRALAGRRGAWSRRRRRASRRRWPRARAAASSPSPPANVPSGRWFCARYVGRALAEPREHRVAAGARARLRRAASRASTSSVRPCADRALRGHDRERRAAPPGRACRRARRAARGARPASSSAYASSATPVRAVDTPSSERSSASAPGNTSSRARSVVGSAPAGPSIVSVRGAASVPLRRRRSPAGPPGATSIVRTTASVPPRPTRSLIVPGRVARQRRVLDEAALRRDRARAARAAGQRRRSSASSDELARHGPGRSC